MIELRDRWHWLLPAALVAMGSGAVLAASLPDILTAYRLSFLDRALWSFTCF